LPRTSSQKALTACVSIFWSTCTRKRYHMAVAQDIRLGPGGMMGYQGRV
jgi:hypothetical protein